MAARPEQTNSLDELTAKALKDYIHLSRRPVLPLSANFTKNFSRSMLRHHFAPILFFSFFSFAAQPTQAALLLQVEQLGNDVVITGSGFANTAALMDEGNDNTWTNVLTDNQIAAGPDAFGDGQVNLWSGILGPASFGSDPTFSQNPDSGSGDLFGIVASNLTPSPQVFLPQGYLFRGRDGSSRTQALLNP